MRGPRQASLFRQICDLDAAQEARLPPGRLGRLPSGPRPGHATRPAPRPAPPGEPRRRRVLRAAARASLRLAARPAPRRHQHEPLLRRRAAHAVERSLEPLHAPRPARPVCLARAAGRGHVSGGRASAMSRPSLRRRLEQQLAAVAAAGERAYIAGHLPPTLDSFRREPMWNQIYADRFFAIVRRQIGASPAERSPAASAGPLWSGDRPASRRDRRPLLQPPPLRRVSADPGRHRRRRAHYPHHLVGHAHLRRQPDRLRDAARRRRAGGGRPQPRRLVSAGAADAARGPSRRRQLHQGDHHARRLSRRRHLERRLRGGGRLADQRLRGRRLGAKTSAAATAPPPPPPLTPAFPTKVYRAMHEKYHSWNGGAESCSSTADRLQTCATCTNGCRIANACLYRAAAGGRAAWQRCVDTTTLGGAACSDDRHCGEGFGCQCTARRCSCELEQ